MHRYYPPVRVLIGFSLIAIGLAGCNVAPLIEGVRTASADHVAGTPLRVATTNGAIIVTKSDRPDVEIVAKVRAQTQERLDAAEIVAERGPDQTLSIHVAWPGNRPLNREGCSFEISIPDATGVTLVTDNGSLDTTDLSGTAILSTTNGSIAVNHHAGPIQAATTNGTVDVSAAQGSVTANAVNGEINISLASEATGPIEANAVNGTIELNVGPSFVGELSLSTTNGTVAIDSALQPRATSKSKSNAQLLFGTSSQRSTATTVNGSVHVGMSGGLMEAEAVN